jgi:hypothetical protein
MYPSFAGPHAFATPLIPTTLCSARLQAFTIGSSFEIRA